MAKHEGWDSEGTAQRVTHEETQRRAKVQSRRDAHGMAGRSSGRSVEERSSIEGVRWVLRQRESWS